jgi:hypothetical protein
MVWSSKLKLNFAYDPIIGCGDIPFLLFCGHLPFEVVFILRIRKIWFGHKNLKSSLLETIEIQTACKIFLQSLNIKLLRSEFDLLFTISRTYSRCLSLAELEDCYWFKDFTFDISQKILLRK